MAGSPARSPRTLVVLAAALVLLLATAAVASRSGLLAGSAGSARAGSGPAVRAADLPSQARDTLALIASGGPFPYVQDGAVFTNREGLLPREPSGYYHEYTVATPGSADRGARRIIAGSGGERYYTDDHYSSFLEVLP